MIFVDYNKDYHTPSIAPSSCYKYSGGLSSGINFHTISHLKYCFIVETIIILCLLSHSVCRIASDLCFLGIRLHVLYICVLVSSVVRVLQILRR